MKKVLFLLLMFLSVCSCKGQSNNPCFKDVLVDRYKKILPQEICIPKGYIIDEIYDSTDINQDGLRDFIFSWRKTDINDGDTIFVSFYKHLSDGTYKYYKTLNNLFPVYFKDYNMSYKITDKALFDIWIKYNGMYPFLNLEITDRDIILKILCAAGEGYNLFYQFDNKIDNWILIKREKWMELPEEIRIKEIAIPSGKLTIDQFNYSDYMY